MSSQGFVHSIQNCGQSGSLPDTCLLEVFPSGVIVCFDILPFAFPSYFPSKNQCYVWWFFFLKTHIRCAIRSIARRKHVGIVMRSLYTTEIIFICPHPLGGFIFPLGSFLSLHLKPASSSAKVVRRSHRCCSTHSYWSGSCGRKAAPVAVVLQQPAQNALGPRGSLATQFDCTAS